MYAGMGGMGSMYGGYGGMGGMGGMPGDPNDPNSLTNSFSQSTQATFQIIESIVGAFGGFAQMLESTYMATHSSFFGMSILLLWLIGSFSLIETDYLIDIAMVSVAEQFGNLRNTLGSVLGIFTILRWLRTLLAKLTGRPPPADATSLTPSAFAAFSGNHNVPATLPDGSPAPPKPSKKPFIMFLIAVFGLPYLMGKLIRALARSQEESLKNQQQFIIGPNGETIPQQPQSAIDPTKLDFCRVLYDYAPETQNTTGVDLAVKKGDLVAVLSKSDPMGNSSEWWRCRARDGNVGYLPSPYLETIQRKPQQQVIAAGSAPGSRTGTMLRGAGSEEPRTRSLSSVSLTKGEKKPIIKGKVGDISPESFQKNMFYS
jgi:peroxin-13